MPTYIVNSPMQLNIVPLSLSGMNFPMNSPIVLPIMTVNELKIVPPAGNILKISSMIIIAPKNFLVIIRDRIYAIKNGE